MTSEQRVHPGGKKRLSIDHERAFKLSSLSSTATRTRVRSNLEEGRLGTSVGGLASSGGEVVTSVVGVAIVSSLDDDGVAILSYAL